MEHPIRKLLRPGGLLPEQRPVRTCIDKAQILVVNVPVSHDRLSTRELALLDELWFNGLPTAEELIAAVVEDGYVDEDEADDFVDQYDTYGDVRHKIAARLMMNDVEVEDWWRDHEFAS